MVGVCVAIETIEQTLYRFAGTHAGRRKARFIVPAVLLHALGLMVWLNLLNKRPLGEVLPLMGANFVTVALAGRVLFGERLTRRRLLGIALVVAGFALVGVSLK
jgi:uncharacterized membrane protein